MRITPSLLLLLLLITVFAPSIQEWVTQGGTAWYRPYLLWLLVIAAAVWNVTRMQRRQAQKSKEQSADES
ncbi:MAG: uncharacterized BrkB/YihY/UPF0761 family membrane protein [Oceanicoccus sp.]|jgi:uncharacterized BrkB/YihY/UPF0761 family membrane protein